MNSVETVPRRAARALHALLLRSRMEQGSSPWTAREVMEYDSEALTVQATVAGLIAARRLGLCSYIRGLWFPTPAGMDIELALERRVLAEDDEREAAPGDPAGA